MGKSKTYSIRRRFAFTAAPVYLLVVFLVFVALDRTFQNTALKGQRERLETVVFSAMGSLVWQEKDRSVDIDEEIFSIPGIFDPDSELALIVLDQEGKKLWSSNLEGFPGDEFESSEVGEWIFAESASELGEFFSLQFAVDWTEPSQDPTLLYFVALQTQREFQSDLKGFRKTLWISVLIGSLLLALGLFFLFEWGMRPAERFQRELAQVRRGERKLIEKNYPVEMEPFKESVNMLLEKERVQSERVGNLLDDLAHGLKTPLAVLRAKFSRESQDEEVQHQVDRIEEAIHFYVKKARSSQRLAFQKPISLFPVLNRLKEALEKANADRDIQIQIEVGEEIFVPLSEPDVFEIFGNLLENAIKYGKGKVWIRSSVKEETVFVEVVDDGDGFDLSKRSEFVKRGFRADESQEGSGIGLHLVSEIADDYGLEFFLENTESGGARVSLGFPGKTIIKTTT